MLSRFRTQQIHMPVNARFIIWIAAATMLLFGVALVAQGQMDLQNYQQQIKQIVKDRTGRDIYIRGGVNVVLLPVPTIYVSGVELRDIEDGRPVPAVTVELLLMTPTLSSLFAEKLEISSVALENPTLEVERAEDGMIYWDWLEEEIFHLLETDEATTSKSLDITGGTVLYINRVTGRKVRVYDININGTTGGIPNFAGSMKFNEQRFDFRVSSTGESTQEDYIPVSLQISSDDENYVRLDGSARISPESLDIKGKMEVDIKDLYPWITLQASKKKPLLESFMQGSRATVDEQTALPVKFSGQWDQSGDKIILSDLVWDGLDSKGKGNLTASFTGGFSVDSNIHFTTLNYSKWRTLVETISDQLSLEEEKRYVIDESLRANVLPEDVQLSFNMTSDEVLIGTQAWNNVRVNVSMEDAALTINQLFIELPGDSTLALFGVVSQSATTRGMRFEGSIETEGKSLKQVLSIFDESVNDIPDMGFEAFFVRSNIYISNDQIRLSEADVRFDELRLGGGLVVYYDAQNPRIEADVRLQDTNFDYFRDVWREQQQAKLQNAEAEEDNFFLRFDKKNINLNWLKRLETSIDLKINVERFTFLERSGDNAYLRLFARQGELGIYNVRFYYPDEVMEMNLTLNVRGEKPFVNLLLNAREIDTAYFSPVAPEATDTEEDVPEAVEEEEQTQDMKVPDIGGFMDSSPAAGSDTMENIIEMRPQAQKLIMLAQSAPESAPSDLTVDFITNMMDEEKNKQSNSKKWSEELIDMSWMDGFDGVFDITIGTLRHEGLVLNGIKVRSTLKKSVLAAQGMSFEYWGGRCQVTGTMYGGKVPGISVGFTLYNIEMQELLSSLSEYEHISGKASISGTLSTSGVNYLSWLSQAEAKMVISGRGVRVKDFSLNGVVNTVKVSRTAADVLNNVNRALVNGSTRMSMDGTINVRNGVFRTPGITLKSGTIVGSLTGDVSVVPWTMDLAMLFQFPAISSDTIPTLLVQLNGSIDDPALTTDTSSLEAYVVKSIKQK